MENLSFRDTVKTNIESFLYHCSFQQDRSIKELMVEDLIDMVNDLSDYYEEGSHLYPDVLLINGFNTFRAGIPCIYYEMYAESYTKGEMKRALKMCAPLTNDGWIMYIVIDNKNISWGMLNLEKQITSLSIFDHIDIDESEDNQVILIHNIGQKTVELKAKNHKVTKISLSLLDPQQNTGNEVHSFCNTITKECEEYKDTFNTFVVNNISDALQKGHGNLIAVIKDSEPDIKVPDVLKDGVTFSEPIDLYSVYMEYYNDNENLSSHSNLKHVVSLFKSMMNHDGVVLVTTKGRIVGYHYIVENHMSAADHINITGGARTKAFKKLCQAQGIYSVLMKQQEGSIKFAKNEND